MLAKFIAAVDPDNSAALAEKLLTKHGSLARLLARSPEAMKRTLGENSQVAAMFVAARALSLEAMRSDFARRAIDPVDPQLLQYLRASMGALADETLRVLFLDASRHLIADEQLHHGTVRQLAFYPRTIFYRAFELGSAAIILVHNHPSGNPAPSECDVAATERLAEIGSLLDVELLEHIVVTASDHRVILAGGSFAGSKLSPKIILRDEGGDWSSAPDAGRALANAQRTSRRRLLRRQLVGAPELFGEPAWDMLIDLFIHEAAGKPVSTSSLCIGSGLPMSSALRLLQRLCDMGLVTREPDQADGRRNFIRLAPDLGNRLMAYFAGGED